MKKIIKILLSILICGFCVESFSQVNIFRSETKQQTQEEKTTKSLFDTVTVIGVGDIMLGTAYPKGNPGLLPPKNDCFPLLADVKSTLISADITIGNLEGVLTDSYEGAKRCSDSSICYVFGMPTSFGACLKDAGFDFLSIANNHSGDFGLRGRKSTMKILDGLGLKYAGLITHATTVIEKDGIRFGFCAFAPNSGTCSILNLPEAKRIVASLESTCDIVIVSFHGGAEGPKYQNVPRKMEEYIGEKRGNVYEFARAVIDAGADIVYGHGPHVPRAIDIYKDRFICYSLGNFCTYSSMNISGISGYAPIAKVSTDKKGNFLSAKIISAIQVKGKGTFLDNTHNVAKFIRDLTRKDFPELSINFSDDGIITLKR